MRVEKGRNNLWEKTWKLILCKFSFRITNMNGQFGRNSESFSILYKDQFDPFKLLISCWHFSMLLN